MFNKGMSTVEYCVLFALVIAAFLAMNGYLKRAIQSNWRSNADAFSEGQYNSASDGGFDPGQSQETVSKLLLVNPQVKAYLNITADEFTYDTSLANATLDVYSGSAINMEEKIKPEAKILQIKKWGTYHDGDSHDD